ncbi:hypothetical protein EDD36DRAFT_159424 [Exophiala viscosa]|uniref:EXPERA domain-containing protein n=1 Tax=Exophiala viscosa TaxID=2486360 RepID=A0AAN6E350_9EURO|nr:hypothetical protein EDD36DRAFT_159424 [Exophiala viscosa]
MVSTRHHPRPFPETPTPTTPSQPKSSSSSPRDVSTSVSPTSQNRGVTQSSGVRQKASAVGGISHRVPPLLLGWLLVSLPLVVWDTGYIFLRPHSMPGGKFHSPIWKPYALYGTVDYVYGWPAWNNHVGFSAAQASLNAVETAMYIYYLRVLFNHGAKNFFVFQNLDEFIKGSDESAITGPDVAMAVLVLFSAAVMTLSKTILYWFNEYFGGFANIGHNTPWNLVLLWIIPNGLWIVLPIYMIYVLGEEMLALMQGSAYNKAK